MSAVPTKWVVLALAVATLMMGITACDRLLGILSDDEVPQMMDAVIPQLTGLSGEIPVGLVIPLTGRLASSYAQPITYGFELALEEINNAQRGDARIKLITEDQKSTVEGAVAAFGKLIHQAGVVAIFGPATSSATREAFPVAQENQTVAISPASSARGLSAIGDYVFRIPLTTDVLVPTGIEATYSKLDYQRVATLYDEDDFFSTDSDEALRKTLTTIGVVVLVTETFRSGDTDFSAQLTRIMALNPEAIFVSALPPEKPAILIQGREVGIPFSVPFVIRTLTTANVRAAGAAAEGAVTFTGWASSIDTPGNRAFVHNYTAKYGIEPTNHAARSYAAFYILTKAIANAGSTDSTAIRDELANIRDFDTILGKFTFDANGDAIYDPVVLNVENGKLKIFE